MGIAVGIARTANQVDDQRTEETRMEHAKVSGIDGKIICAGLPRSGTTMMFRALAGLPPGNNTPNEDLNGCLKTHSFRPLEFAGAKAAIFLFGDPVLSVISTRLRRYGPKHFTNCGAHGIDPETADIYSDDVLNYSKMFHAWTRHQPFPLAVFRYETIHDNITHLEGFLNREVTLPEKRPRKTSVDMVPAEILERIERAYADLIVAVEAAPDVAFYGPISR